MKILKPDFSNRIAIEGVAEPCLRPVDIEPAKTGFKNLRTLRVYRFEPGAAIDGHAEEDEVFLVLLAGEIEITLSGEGVALEPQLLRGATEPSQSSCVAYIPPGGAYKLVARERADVAYVRATPTRGRAPRLFPRTEPMHLADAGVLVECGEYAEKLRLRVVQLDACVNALQFVVIAASESTLDALVHITTLAPAGELMAVGKQGTETKVESWDTIAVPQGERLTLRLAEGTLALATIVLA